jgi:hypothetical protein
MSFIVMACCCMRPFSAAALAATEHSQRCPKPLHAATRCSNHNGHPLGFCFTTVSNCSMNFSTGATAFGQLAFSTGKPR